MRIDPRSSSEIQFRSTTPTRGSEPITEPRTDAAGGDERPARPDRVEISTEGRALAAAGAGGLTAERVTEIRQRILAGAYDSTAVIDTVARRMLARGDI
jgi:anti-sigma28 factor (negative regulator of flagellin synthesis)